MFPPLISLTAELIKAPRVDFLLGCGPRSLAPTPLLLRPSVRSSSLLRLHVSHPLPVFSAVSRWRWGHFCGSSEGHVTRPEGGKRQKSDKSMALAVDAVTKIALRFPTADLAGLWWWWGGPRLAPEHAASCAPNLSFNNAGADGAAAAAAQPATSIVGQQRMMRLTQTAAPATPGSPQDICCL